MTYTKLMTAAALLGAVAIAAPVSAEPQSHARGSHQAAQAAQPQSRAVAVARPERVVVGQAVPRVGRPPRIVDYRRSYVPYRPYYYRPYYYRPAYRIGLGFGYYSYPYGYYPYAYPAYGYPYGYPYYGYGYGYPGYPVYAGRPYGGVRITDAPRDAEVYADGYYVGVVDDFDGVFQELKLEPGPHRIEVRAPGRPPVAFDVRVQPGQTITYRAEIR